MKKRIAIHSVPRSGSSWLGQLFNSSTNVCYRLQPLFSYAFKSALTLNSTREDVINFFNNIAKSDDEFINSTQHIKEGRYPQFEKEEKCSHIAYKEVRYHNLLEHLMKVDNELILVALTRNPKAALNSWFNAPKEFKKELNWSKDEEWLDAPKKNLNKPEEFNGFRKWLECEEIFNNIERKHPDRIFRINYDELLIDTEKVIKDVFNFCKIPFDSQTQGFLNESKSQNDQDAYSVYKVKKVDNSWEKELDPKIINEIDRYLRKHGYNNYIN